MGFKTVAATRRARLFRHNDRVDTPQHRPTRVGGMPPHPLGRGACLALLGNRDACHRRFICQGVCQQHLRPRASQHQPSLYNHPCPRRSDDGGTGNDVARRSRRNLSGLQDTLRRTPRAGIPRTHLHSGESLPAEIFRPDFPAPDRRVLGILYILLCKRQHQRPRPLFLSLDSRNYMGNHGHLHGDKVFHNHGDTITDTRAIPAKSQKITPGYGSSS